MDTAYQRTQKQMLLHGRPFAIQSLSPYLAEEERALRQKEIESRLFDIFSPYLTGQRRPE